MRPHRIDLKCIESRRQFGRKVQGIAAALLPFQSNGRIAVEAFQGHLARTHAVGLINAVNMDTGYVNYLSETQKKNVLEWTRAALGKNVPFVAGAYIENLKGEIVSVYRRQLDSIVGMGGIPILFQTARLKATPGRKLAATYQAVCRGYQNVLAFELGSMFAGNGKIFKGPQQISEHQKTAMQSVDPGVKVTVTTSTVWLDGDTAYETGKYKYEYKEKGKPAVDEGRYVTVWKRQKDGSWKLAMDMGVPEK